MTSGQDGREDHPFPNNSPGPHCQDIPFSANRSFADSPRRHIVRGSNEGVVQTELPWIDSPCSNGGLCLPTNDLSTRRNLEEKKFDGRGVGYLMVFFSLSLSATDYDLRAYDQQSRRVEIYKIIIISNFLKDCQLFFYKDPSDFL
ncbi:hypothetical protein AAC387_Pa03g2521 [Persea americana]|eukprot:TRINITY_DN5309_c0_g2_i2.p1 TRINITY_DN5309_c0_g2~~TRINITY_DN5309_c0_g2_i2.p1  ORF type:complete len:145 (+),score=16.05 TRINITY_DN5309_c0_g2_i2:222-656(+)